MEVIALDLGVHRQQIYRLRTVAWSDQVEKDQLAAMIIEDDDLRSSHFGVMENQVLVGSGRLTVAERSQDLPSVFGGVHQDFLFPFGVFSRLVVHPNVREKGIARAIDKIRLSAALRARCRAVGVSISPCRETAIRSLGFLQVTPWSVDYFEELTGNRCDTAAKFIKVLD